MARISRGDLPDQLPFMVDGDGLLLGRGVRTMSQTLCGECLIPISECAHKLYLLDELERDANRLKQLAKERKELTK